MREGRGGQIRWVSKHYLLCVDVAGRTRWLFDPPKTVTKEDVANQIMQKKWDAAGNKPESVSRPVDLRPVVGAKVVCEMTINGQTVFVDVTVTGIDGDNVELNMQGHRLSLTPAIQQAILT